MIDIGTSQKPIYDLVLVNNTNLHRILHHFHIVFDRGCLSQTHSFSVVSANIAMSRLLPKKLDPLDIFVADNIRLPLTSLTWSTLNANAFSVITHHNGHYAVQGHFGTPLSPL